MTAQSTVIKAPGEKAAEQAGGAGRPGKREGRRSEGTALNVFSHGFLVVWAIMIVLPCSGWRSVPSRPTRRSAARP